MVMIKLYNMDKLLADIAMIDGKLQVMDYDGYTKDFLEEIRVRQSSQNAVKKVIAAGSNIFPPESDWEPVSDQELYDTFHKHLGGMMWIERDD
jgi:hypothetical protein